MKSPLACCVIGDVNLDYISDLSEQLIDGSENACFQNPISMSVGGNGVFFAEAARESGFTDVYLLCSLGNDVAGQLARQYLQQKGIIVHDVTGSGPTGTVFIVYQPNDHRIMIADRGANKSFCAPPKELVGTIASTCNVLYISGYMFLEPQQRARVIAIAEMMKTAGVRILVDMVPHDVWKMFSWTEYVKICSIADIITAELITISIFTQGLDSTMHPETAIEMLLEHFPFCIVRINSNSDFIAADHERTRTFRVPYSRQAASLRFTDRVIAHVVKQYRTDPEQFFRSDSWLDKLNQLFKT